MWITYRDPLWSDPLHRDPLWGDPLWVDPLWSDPLRSICCVPHDTRGEGNRQAMRNSRPSEQIGIVIGFGFGWLTFNRIEFAMTDTRQLLPGRNFGPQLNTE